MKTLLLSIAIIFAASTSINAQTSTVTVSQTVTLILKNCISINLTSATGSNFNFENTANYANGVTNTNAAVFQVKSNLAWAVSVKTTTANFNGPAASATMPSSVLGVRVNGGTNFAALSTTATPLTNGNRGMASFGVDYNAAPGYDYEAGTYTINVVYTATQQ